MIISKSQIIANAFSYKKTDEALINQQAIDSGEIAWLKPVLGEDMFDEIIAESQTSYSAENQTLVDDYIIPFLSWALYADILPDIVFQSSSQGILQHTPTFSNNVGRTGLQLLREQALKRADIYKQELIDYIKDNSTDYPLYCNDQSDTTTIGGIVCY